MKKRRRLAESGAADLREIAAAFVRVGSTRAALFEAAGRVFEPLMPGERAWLRKAWSDAVRSKGTRPQGGP